MKPKEAILKMFCRTKRNKRLGNIENSPYHIIFGMCLAAVLLFAGMDVVSATPITFSNIEVTSVRNTSVVIQWDTEVAATGQIEYGLDANYGNLSEIEDLSYWHPIGITGLTEGTLYHYRIRANDYKGVETLSNDYTFTTCTTIELENVIKAARSGGDLPKTYYVSTSGNNSDDGRSLETAWGTPSYAAQQAEAGDTIYLLDGEWIGGITDFANSGIAEAPITMKAYNGTPTIANNYYFYIHHNDYITVDGLTFHNSSGHGIDVRYATGVKILNCTVYGSEVDGIYFGYVFNYAKIENCFVSYAGWNGIGMKPQWVQIDQSTHSMLKDNRVEDCPYHNGFDTLIDDYMTLINCSANNTKDKVYRIHGNYVMLEGSSGSNGAGVDWNVNNNTMIHNCTFDNGIWTQDPTFFGGSLNNLTIANNYIAKPEAGWAGVIFVPSENSGVLIEENEIHTTLEGGHPTYDLRKGHFTLRNESHTQYIVQLTEGASVDVEYTDGRTFSVNGVNHTNNYTLTGWQSTIEVFGAPSVGTISGTVTDMSTGSGIEGATVSVEGTGKSAQTVLDGTYTITGVPVKTDTYTVTCTAPDYQDTYQSNIEVSEGAPTTVIFVVLSSNITPIGDLVGEWDFDEGTGTRATDSSGNNMEGTIYGATWTNGGLSDCALQFDGTDGYVGIPHNSSLSSVDQTVELWFKPATSPPYGDSKGLIFKAHNTGYNREFGITIKSIGRITFSIYDGVSESALLYSSTLVSANNWYHVALVKEYGSSGDTFRAFVNGVEEANTTVSWHGVQNTNEIVIGKASSSSYDTRYFNGTIDEVKIYNRALSVEEVREDYEAGLNGAANTLSGSVTSLNSTGLADATVTLATPEGTVINTSQTDSTGHYEFTEVSPGNYNINATKRSYWPDSDPVTVTAESPETADISLCQKGDLNTNSEPADAGDLAMMADATVNATLRDETYDLDGDGNPADAADLTLLKDVSVGVAELE